jgi:MFS family permease
VNLALGILYAWSVIKGAIPDDWGWNNADKALPYSVACAIFAAAMIPAGRMQDRFGPRLMISVGGLFVGLGFIVAGLMGASLAGFVLGFGVLGGIGIGCCYSSTTPPAVKWFPPARTGLIAGIVVGGFGLAPVYIAPLAKFLTGAYGISTSMLIFGGSFALVILGFAQIIRNPKPEEAPKKPETPAGQSTAVSKVDRSWKETLATPQFYILWLMFFAGSAAGLTFISIAQDLGKKSLGELAFVAVAILAVGNASGRILAGFVSDRIGRPWTLFGTMLIQAATVGLLFLLQGSSSIVLILLIIISIGANYGSNLALFPSSAKDFFGLKNFGLNYGLLFSAWGAAGLVMPIVNGRIKDATGANDMSFAIIIGMLLIAAGLTFVSRKLAKTA